MKVITKLREQGVMVDVTRLDVTVPEQAAMLVADIETQAPIAGIFHLAMVLDDRLLARQVSALAPQALLPCSNLPREVAFLAHLEANSCCNPLTNLINGTLWSADRGKLEPRCTPKGTWRLELA